MRYKSLLVVQNYGDGEAAAMPKRAYGSAVYATTYDFSYRIVEWYEFSHEKHNTGIHTGQDAA